MRALGFLVVAFFMILGASVENPAKDNTMRVSFQIATDYTHSAYPIMGISGFIEVVGLTL